ncbi:unnamed protein product [Spirodela intermedia]|uniref:Uncharacterized protein n=1 Tax=Spirodela intermedia TaxID=51605 RepID=A0A7I8LBN9_SPIIN|nr:unnamed protein product [Spirodela intermedia]
MDHRVVSGGCHPAKQKNSNFAALWWLSLDGKELDGGGARVRSFILRSAQQEEVLHRIWYALRRNSFHPLRHIINSNSFILRSVQQEEAHHRIRYALRRWRLTSRRIVLFSTTACSSINRR